LNHTPRQSLAGYAPIEAFTGLKACNPFQAILNAENASPVNMQLDKRTIKKKMDELRVSLDDMHGEIQNQRLKQELLNQKYKRGQELINFEVGDFVLRSRIDDRCQRNKLLVRWVGPYRVLQADAYSYVIQDMITKKEMDVHPSRLQMYCEKWLDQDEDILDHIALQGMTLAVKGIKNHRYNEKSNQYEVLISWKGLDD
jgi:hypothetical protein